MSKFSGVGALRLARNGELKPHTSAHFSAYVRGAAVKQNDVRVDARLTEDWRVPEDGIWRVDGRHVPAGTEVTLWVGAVVSYQLLETAHADDDRPALDAPVVPIERQRFGQQQGREAAFDVALARARALFPRGM